jgi:hypothetical protein
METTTLHEIEERRLGTQVCLDSRKTALERNKLGQFATPAALAVSLARHASSLLGDTPVRFLDPSVGTGSFFSALLNVYPADSIAAAAGVELDPLFADTAKSLWADSGLQVSQADFTRLAPPTHGFNLVLANPPYVRHHHLPASEKDRLKAQLANSLRLPISGLAGLYCYFLLQCHEWMEEDGLALWLIPSEFMDVNYGSTLRRYLTERVTLLQIHRFCPTDVQFTDALVSSAVVIFRKSHPPPNHSVRFSFAGPIEQPRSEALVPVDMLKRSGKWTQFPARTTDKINGDLTLGDLFAIKRGLATGANSYFILTADEVREWSIPGTFVKPILPSPRHVVEDIVEALPSGDPDISPRLYLLDCDESEDRIQTNWPRFYEYLQHGKLKKVDSSYIASHRTSWYAQERRPPAPFLCTYMGRSRNGKHPFRFIWNRSQATAHNVYLMLYPKGQLRLALSGHPDLAAQVFKALQLITPSQLLSEGRVYGGGLHKVEPKELAQISARPLLDIVEPYVRIERQTEMFA